MKSLPQQSETIVTRWKCERCLLTGTVTLPRHAGVFEGFYVIEDDHHKASPYCEAPTRDLRVSLEDESA